MAASICRNLESHLDDQLAVFMITNPNTLGLFDHQVTEIAARVHESGRTDLPGWREHERDPGDHPAGRLRCRHDALQSTQDLQRPARRRWSGRRADLRRCRPLEPYLPTPIVARGSDGYILDHNRPRSIGRVRSFFGNVGVLVRAYAYIRTHGPQGLRQVSENAVLNANYLLSRVKHILPVPHGDRCMHEFVASRPT